MTYSVRVYFDDFGNHPSRWIIGQVRRLADEFGRPGIEGKRGQNNARVRRKGYLRVKWPSRKLAQDYQAAVDEPWAISFQRSVFWCGSVSDNLPRIVKPGPVAVLLGVTLVPTLIAKGRDQGTRCYIKILTGNFTK